MFGAVWNIVTLAVIAAPAQWFWGGPPTPAPFAGDVLLPHRIDALFGETVRGTDPRDVAGSSGAMHFLAAILAAGLLPTSPATGERLPAACVPAAGLAMWVVQENRRSLLACYGFVLGGAVLLIGRLVPHGGAAAVAGQALPAAPRPRRLTRADGAAASPDRAVRLAVLHGRPVTVRVPVGTGVTMALPPGTKLAESGARTVDEFGVPPREAFAVPRAPVSSA
ncbi:hypothetical protein [Streptomyces camelliae]|uniref:Uncharacterized protein n=1 Tax=Streptomyces camelliae TaxID=3004093 RepID=A0ABY7PIY2_9ACTN|nr:hypothetical protein [Streptomyces sp. HUAS 2-6]WBO68403.1 hypothetical protein O1G22_39100 [Streptomyces sp. HUAS 2-6]